jgi:A/G-specific adenine glycosylase
MRKISRQKVSSLHKTVISWYRFHKRELDWRKTRDPYVILISEIMLQQTQVARVREKLPLFLKSFPTVRSLAAASKADVLRAWKGMGYNNRAIRLHEMARSIRDNYHGTIPRDIETLLTLPGIGPYTAHALSCFAFRKSVPLVDVNIRRVLSRVFRKIKNPTDAFDEPASWKFAEDILPQDAYTWNQALMDIGATICTARRPSCNSCPIATLCCSRSSLQNISTQRPNLQPKKPEPTHDGVPRRIWRGRIVEALRNVNGNGSISLPSLGKTIKPDFRKADDTWLRSLIILLENDGIVETQNRRSTTFVSLAS